MKGAYYNDIDHFCCDRLEELIAEGAIDAGFVDRRDIREVDPEELRDYCHIHLFAGLGGFPLGFRLSGYPAHLRTVTGGFPCQDISFCGYGAGLEGERSGLWREHARIIRGVRPDIAIVENVSALLYRGVGRVLADLAEIGFDAEWDCLPASAFGAYHDRDRIFIVAYPAEGNGKPHDLLEAGEKWRASFQSRRLHSMAVATRAQRENSRLEHEPGLARMVLRIPNQVERLEALGNTVTPQVVEWICRRISKQYLTLETREIGEQLPSRGKAGCGEGKGINQA